MAKKNSSSVLQSRFFEDLQKRELISQVTDPQLGEGLNTQPFTLYVGVDPTAESLHIGSLLPLITLKRFQEAGHSTIVVLGGATGLIGDPSGKSQERQLLSQKQIDKNSQAIKKQISKILSTSGPNPVQIVNNIQWFEKISFIDFLRDAGKHFTVNHMLAKESVRARLEDRTHGISFTEFSYMLLQAYDFYHLFKKMNCRLQIGGSDQWGNITAGCELIRRLQAAHEEEPVEVYGLTHPLVTKADGSKFGKTEQGNLWLDPDRTSPYQLFQFFLQTSDADVIRLLKFFTFLPLERISELEISLKIAPEKREAQTELARTVVSFLHGEKALEQSQSASQALFGEEVKSLDPKTLRQALSEAPTSQRARSELQAEGTPLIDLLVDTGLCTSKGNARKEVAAGGIYLNNLRIQDPMTRVKTSDLIGNQYIVLRKGKKTYHLVDFG